MKNKFKVYCLLFCFLLIHFYSVGHEKKKRKQLSIYLLDYTIEYDDPLTKKENYIKKRMKEFFSKQNFQQPAIGKNEKFDNDYTEILKSIYDEIQADPKRNGFYYFTDGENGRQITFSKMLKKVVIYKACC